MEPTAISSTAPDQKFSITSCRFFWEATIVAPTAKMTMPDICNKKQNKRRGQKFYIQALDTKI